MKNLSSSTNAAATIKGSSRPNNKRSLAAMTTRFSLAETTPNKKPTTLSSKDKIEAQDPEEEEEESMDIGVSKGVMSGKGKGKGKGKGSISATLTDPDVLDCPICFMPFTIPLFQCENGHIACASCCTKLVNKCPSCNCSSPTGFKRCGAIEKIVESLKVPCPNGCNHSIIYTKLREHEATCIHTPCSCPNRSCKFVGSSNQVYTHFTTTHVKAKHITFNTPRHISLKKNQRFIYLVEKSGGVIFVVNHHMHRLGRAVNIICIAPGSSKRTFLYTLLVAEERCVKANKGSSSGEKRTTSIKLEAVAENIPNWDPSLPLNIFLLVPDDVISDACDDQQLKLEVCINDS